MAISKYTDGNGLCPRLRIAYVVHDYHRYGGHSRYVAELACRFRRNHDVHVFTNTVDDADRYGITFHHVPAWRRNALTTVLSFIVPGTLAVRGRFDIVHAQGLCGLRQNVITAHICQPAWFAAADRYGEQAGWRKRVFRAVVGRLEQFGLRPAAAVRFIAPSARVKDDLATYYRLKDRVCVIHHGIDTQTFHPRNRARWRDDVRSELELMPTDCVALYVGDLQKAMPAAVRTLTLVPSVKLVAVSRSDPAPYEIMARTESVAERVRLVPATTDIARYYAAADMFLFPSYYDAFGMVVTEAMASGLPVVASRAAGAGELIAHQESGWLTADAWDAQQIAEPVRLLAADPGLRERMGAAARAAVATHTWDRVADDTMSVYREVVAEERR